jgi:type I restriction enzyme S subunit
MPLVQLLEISGKVLGRMGFQIPSKTEQTQIGNFFKNLDTLITLHQRKYEKLGVLKKAMLEKMFPKTGLMYPKFVLKGLRGLGKRGSWGRLCK